MITVDEGFISSITGYVGVLFNDFMPLILLLGGVFIGFYIIENIIEVVLRRRTREKHTEWLHDQGYKTLEEEIDD